MYVKPCHFVRCRVLPEVGKLVIQYRPPMPGQLPAVRTGVRDSKGNYNWGKFWSCNGRAHAQEIALKMNAEPFNFDLVKL